MEELPDEIIFHILAYLQIKDLQHVFLLNHYFCRFMYDSMLWKIHILRDFPTAPNALSYSSMTYRCSMYRRIGKAKIITVPRDIFPRYPNDFINFMNRSFESIVNSPTILDYIRTQGAKKGDIIHVEAYKDYEGVLNNGKVIYDGSKILNLKCYRSTIIPEEFQIIDEFPITYWYGLLAATTYQFYFKADSYVNEIYNNIKPLRIKGNISISHFEHWNGYLYTVLIYGKEIYGREIKYEIIKKNLLNNMFMSHPYVTPAELGSELESFNPETTLHLFLNY